MPPQTYIVNPSFHIQSPDLDTASSHLFVEAGPAAVSIAVLNDRNCFTAVVLYPLQTGDTGSLVSQLQDILQDEPLLQLSYRKTAIIWNFRESSIIPAEYMNRAANNELLDLVYGPSDNSAIRTDFLYRSNLHNIYRVPEPADALFRNKFLFASHTHHYSVLPEAAGKGEGNRLWVAFNGGGLTVVLFKDEKFQLVQQFRYSGADDAAYYLLNTCQRFDIEPSEVQLQLCGMIDADSNLYIGIYKYFMNISWFELPDGFEYSPEIKEQPAHFFSPLFATAACV